MKYAIQHKTTYSALSDLLGLVSLHLPNNSKKDHLKSLYFLKKAFSSKLHKDEMVTVNEYCPDCSSPFDDDTKKRLRVLRETQKQTGKKLLFNVGYWRTNTEHV